VEQLREGGQMVIPLGERYQQTLFRFTKQNGMLESEPLEPTFFVPMTGRAEQLREKKADSALPQLLNGGFETTDDKGKPSGWYYLRQAELIATDAIEGQHYLQFRNDTPGRGAQILQAIGIDGQQIKSLKITLWIRTESAGPITKQTAPVELNFFDEQRAPAGVRHVGPWPGTSAWTKKESLIEVPIRARLAVLAIGLFGRTGQLAVDGMSLEVTERR
jgi:protein-L-isoaspartate(D-aspartate) O-methyltransferase